MGFARACTPENCGKQLLATTEAVFAPFKCFELGRCELGKHRFYIWLFYGHQVTYICIIVGCLGHVICKIIVSIFKEFLLVSQVH